MSRKGFPRALKAVSDTNVRPASTIDASASDHELLLIYRHSSVIRLTHWVGVACVAILLMSGLQIFNAHPALYLGHASRFEHPVVSIRTAEKDGREIGVTDILGQRFNTTGLLGLSGKDNSDEHAFPAWATLPGYQDLAGGRRWHFFFAWLLVFDGLIYLIYSLASGHLSRDLIPSASQLRNIGRSVLDHVRLRFPRGEEARRYNVLQRLAYLIDLVRGAAAPGPCWPGHVSGPRCGIPRPDNVLWRPANGPDCPFRVRFPPYRFCGCACADGASVGGVEQPALHDHRMVCDQTGGRLSWLARLTGDASWRGWARASLHCPLPAAILQDPTVRRVLNGAESLTKSAQRLLLSRQSLAQEFSEADISRHFRANGSTDPDDPAYVSLAKSGFQDWRLEVAGLVSTPLSLIAQRAARVTLKNSDYEARLR